ncbi:MAG TPA: methyltransferase [Polyangiaceae bacterium]|jgi:SAM-dependent methyltransferase
MLATVELPDAGRLLSLGPEALRALGLRLQGIGLGPAFASRLARVGERQDDALRAPMRVWHARRMNEPAAVAVRVFVLHDPVAPGEAQEALGDLAPLREAGFVEERDGGIVSRVHLALAGGVLCFGDLPGLGGEAVMPVCGATLELVRAVLPGAPVERALDLGCGAAPVALLLARSVRHVVATDVNPRAALYARLNAAVNGVENLDVRVGDLYETVGGERFDRVAAHPPFVARPATAPASTFIHGGTRGDELPLRVLARARDHLTPGGRAVVLGDWPVVDGDALEARVRAAVGSGGVDVLVLQSPSKNLDEYCVLLAAVEHGELGSAFARAAIAHREHLEQLGMRGLALACVVLTPGSGWTSMVPVRHVHDAPLTGDAIDRLISARRLAFGPPEALAKARLRVPTGARLVEQPMPGGAPLSVVVQLPAGRPEWPAVLDGALATRVARIAGAARVEEAGDEAMAAAREALLRGALDVT